MIIPAVTNIISKSLYDCFSSVSNNRLIALSLVPNVGLILIFSYLFPYLIFSNLITHQYAI